ncbi:TolC family protein [Stieleria varia]|uniref:Cation efflux system protein CusC n=1 Tax=Stieleria varia TaxID=2528005 RepID=A0A5C6AQG2_9BACT|nr:TolC family protein [Stieleria varia]TWU01306.1 Cation efflux system protein CusC precursor [Stieleria varia]
MQSRNSESGCHCGETAGLQLSGRVNHRKMGWLRMIALVVFSGFAGCASKGPMPSYSTSSLPPMSESGQTESPDRWWTTFNDRELDSQVNRALGENLDLAIALQRLRAAQAVTRREASDLYPDLNGFFVNQNSFGPGPTDSRIDWGLDAAYQVDLWGRNRTRVAAEQLRTEATRADYHAVALTLSAEIARNWFALIEASAQIELLEEQVETNVKGLKAVELRYAEIGEGGSPNVLRQRGLVQSTLEQIIVVKADMEVLEHRLSVLTGQPPQTASYITGSDFPELPPLPYTGLPSELLSRRPDVRAAYLALEAADRDVAVAVRDQYPRLDLSASLVNSAENPETLFRDWFLSIGGQLLGPILDGGQRRAEVDRRKALVCERFAAYRQAILIALQEVEDGLALERYQIERIEKLETQVQLAQLASEQLLQFFITGEATYLDVLSSNQTEQRLQRSLLSARLDLILNRIRLYLALAGDFDTRPDPSLILPPSGPQNLSEITIDVPPQELDAEGAGLQDDTLDRSEPGIDSPEPELPSTFRSVFSEFQSGSEQNIFSP